MTKRNSLIDITKLFFSICIIFIHTGLCDKITYGYELKEFVFRLGIPFFFVCSGYYFAKKNIGTREKLYLYLKKILIPFIIFGLIYTFFEAYFLSEGLFDYVISNISKMFLGSQSNVMWYSGLLIWSCIILYLIKNEKQLIVVIFISFILYLIGLSFTTYDFLLNEVNPLLLNALKNTFGQNRSFWFVGLLYTSIGYYIGKQLKIDKVKNYKLFILLIFSTVLCILEVLYIKGKTIYFEYDFLVSYIPLIIILFILIVRCKNLEFNTKFMRNLSTTIYYIHFGIIYLFKYLSVNYVWFDNVFNISNLKYDVTICIVTILLAIIFNIIPNKYLKMVVN